MTGHNPYLEMLAYRSELTADKEQRLREHLEGCHDCRQVAEAYALQSSMLRSMPLVDPPPALRAAVLNRLREAPPQRAWLPRIAFMLSPVAAALVVVVAALAFLTRSHDATHQNASGPATVTHTHQTPTAAVRSVPLTGVKTVHRGGHSHHRVKPPSNTSTPGQVGGSVPTVSVGGPFDNGAPILSQQLPPTVVTRGTAPTPTPARVAASVYSSQRSATAGRKQTTYSAHRPTSTPQPTPTVPGLAAAAPPPPIRAAQPLTPQPTPTLGGAASTPIPAVPPSIVPLPASPQPVFSSPGPQPTPTP